MLIHNATRLGSVSSRLRFTRTPGGDWKEWDRFIELDERPAFHIGNVCNTCSFFFERKGGANQSLNLKDLEQALERGIADLSDPAVDQIASVLPEAEYKVLLLELQPTLVRPLTPGDYFSEEQVQLWGVDPFWALPHDCRSFYYRTRTRDMGNAAQLFEFVVPMFPPSWLEVERVSHFESAMASGTQSTAFALSVLDVKAPAMWLTETKPEVTEHFCLAHDLLDGHHKVNAASRSGKAVRLLSFLAVEHGLASPEETDRAIKALESTTT